MLKATAVIVGLLSSLNAFAHQAKPHCERELTAAAEVFAPRQLSKASLPGRSGWELLWHRTSRGEAQLVAFHRSNLIVRRLNPWTGGIINEKHLLPEGVKPPTEAQAHSTAGGELLVASLRAPDRTIELISDRADFKLSVTLEQDIRQMEVVSLGSEVFIAANTINTIILFKRKGQQLEKVASIESQPLLRKMFAFKSGDSQISLAFLATDHKMRLFNWDDEINELKEGPGFVQLGGRAEPQAVNGQVIFVNSDENNMGITTLRLFSTGSRVFTRNLELKTVIGKPVFRDDGKLLIPVRNGERSELVHIDSIRGRIVDSTGLGDARSISDLSLLRLGGKDFTLFTKDAQIVYIQNDNETSILPAPPRSQIRQLTGAIRMNNGQTAVAILGEGPAGTGISVIGLNE